MSFHPWERYKSINLYRHESGAFTYVTPRMRLDADGSPKAYHPQDYPTGSDYLANAGYPRGGWDGVLVRDPGNPDQPYVQSSGPHQGFFVSKTSLQDRTKAVTSPSRYVNSDEIPYLVFPGRFYAMPGTGRMGDLAMVRNLANGKLSFAIVADGGPFEAPLGEVSLKLAEALGGTPPISPASGTGTPSGRFQVVLFPGSYTTPPWPRAAQEMEAAAQALLASVGGWPDEASLAALPTGRQLVDPSATWTLLIHRDYVQINRSGEKRTVGTYQVFHGAELVPGLSGTIAEQQGPGDNGANGDENDLRIQAGRYALSTQVGGLYRTVGYSPRIDVSTFPMPGLQLNGTQPRSDILIHPGKDRFLSSVGCLNPCTSLHDASEPISFVGSRRRVIAMIDDLKALYGNQFPTGEAQLPGAFVQIVGEP
jgi:hypothetical protein